MAQSSADLTKAEAPEAIWLVEVEEDTYLTMTAGEIKMLENAAQSSADLTKAEAPKAIWLVEVGEDTYLKMTDREIKMLENAIAFGQDTVEHVWKHTEIYPDGSVWTKKHFYTIDIANLIQTNIVTGTKRKLLRVA